MGNFFLGATWEILTHPKGHDGLLKTEDPNIAAKDMIAKTAFAEMDKNKDGKVTKEEFVTDCLGKQEISKMLALKLVDIFVEDD